MRALLLIRWQRLVHVYTATAWFDALCQLYTCFLSPVDRAELAAEMTKPDAIMAIRMMSVATGVLHALLPRSTRWKLSLYVSRQLIVLGVVIHFSMSQGSLGAVRSFLLDSCTPFLIAFCAVGAFGAERTTCRRWAWGWPAEHEADCLSLGAWHGAR